MSFCDRTVFMLCCGLALTAGCATSSPEPTPTERSSQVSHPLRACGLDRIGSRRAPATVEGDASTCFVAMGPSARLQLTKDPGDFGLMGPELLFERDGVSVYQGRGTRPDSHLYSATRKVSGYFCVVNGFESAEAAVEGVAACSLIEGDPS